MRRIFGGYRYLAAVLTLVLTVSQAAGCIMPFTAWADEEDKTAHQTTEGAYEAGMINQMTEEQAAARAQAQGLLNQAAQSSAVLEMEQGNTDKDQSDQNQSQTENPYKEAAVTITESGWVDIGSYSPQDIRGVSFEIGCKTDWNGGGGGGVFIDNWDNTPQFSFTTLKNGRIECKFTEAESLRLKQAIKLNIWWTWADADGTTHVKELYFKEGSVRLILDRDAENITKPTASSKTSGGGGGGSSSGSSSGTASVGNNNSFYKYAVKERGVTKKIQVSDICPEYQLGDIVRITMKTLGGDEWNSFELYCTEDGETVKVSKPGNNSATELTLEAKPDNGAVFVTINWLGGDYMLWGFETSIIGHGEPVEDIELKRFTADEFEAEKGEYFYTIPISIEAAMETIGAEWGIDEVTITVGMESDGWWNGKLSCSSVTTGSPEDYYNGFDGSASYTCVPIKDDFTVNIGTFNGTYGVIKNLKVVKTGNQVEKETVVSEINVEEANNGGTTVEIPLSEAMEAAGAEFNRDEVRIILELDSDSYWNGRISITGVYGAVSENTFNSTGFGKEYILICYPAKDDMKLWTETVYGSYATIKSVTVEKTGNVVDPDIPEPETVVAEINIEEANNGGTTAEIPLAEAMEAAGAEFNRDEVRIILELDSDSYWNGKISITGVYGAVSENTFNSTGFGKEYTLTCYPAKDDLKLWTDTVYGSYATIISVTVEKTGNMVEPDIPEEPEAVVAEIDYETYADAEGPNTYGMKNFDIKDKFSEAVEEALDQTELDEGGAITITAAFESSNTEYWQLCGDIVLDPNKEQNYSSVGGTGQTLVWKGTYHTPSWIELQVKNMKEGGYLKLVSLEVEIEEAKETRAFTEVPETLEIKLLVQNDISDTGEAQETPDAVVNEEVDQEAHNADTTQVGDYEIPDTDVSEGNEQEPPNEESNEEDCQETPEEAVNEGEDQETPDADVSKEDQETPEADVSEEEQETPEADITEEDCQETPEEAYDTDGENAQEKPDEEDIDGGIEES